MKKRCFGISYLFTPLSKPDEISKYERIGYTPLVVYKEDGKALEELRCPMRFEVTSSSILLDSIFMPEKTSFYIEMQKKARAAQERIISEYICTIILDKAREYPDEELTFLIRDEFQTEKIVGRLGYLGLPMHRLHIMFVSYELSAFIKHYIEYYSVPLRTDLFLLFQDKYRGKVLGPYPDDDRISMLRTYYCSYSLNTGEDLYPVRINLFGQMLEKEELNSEKEHIKEIFMESSDTEVYPILGGKGSEKTRLPAILVECEEYVKQESLKDEG